MSRLTFVSSVIPFPLAPKFITLYTLEEAEWSFSSGGGGDDGTLIFGAGGGDDGTLLFGADGAL